MATRSRHARPGAGQAEMSTNQPTLFLEQIEEATGRGSGRVVGGAWRAFRWLSLLLLLLLLGLCRRLANARYGPVAGGELAAQCAAVPKQGSRAGAQMWRGGHAHTHTRTHSNRCRRSGAYTHSLGAGSSDLGGLVRSNTDARADANAGRCAHSRASAGCCCHT